MTGIKARGLEKRFGIQQIRIIKAMDLDIQQGEFVAVTGRSGSGKSTLLYLLSGLDEPSDGLVMIDGKNIHTLDSDSIHKFRNEEMGFVFQFHYLLPELNALENILMPARKLHLHDDKIPYAMELLKRFEVDHCAMKKPSQMSGGEQQRIAIIRAIIMNPRYLFADEPTGNLDSVNGETVMEIFSKINTELKTTIIMVTHEPDFAAKANRQIYLIDGQIDKDTLQNQPKP